jgi:hypothetical protein
MFSGANERRLPAVDCWFSTAENTWQAQKATIMPACSVYLVFIES